MKYRVIKIEIDNIEQEHIIIHNEDGSFKSFPKDENNPEYVAFQEHIDEYEKVVE